MASPTEEARSSGEPGHAATVQVKTPHASTPEPVRPEPVRPEASPGTRPDAPASPTATGARKTPASASRWRWLMVTVGVVITIGLAMAVSIPAWSNAAPTELDQAHNLMTGIFFHDMARDLPVNPIEYTFDYYRQYPALGLKFWPPLFHVAVGAVCLVLGPSVLAAHVTLTLFVLCFAICAFALLARHVDPLLAAAGVAGALTFPMIAGLSSNLMLEIPALALLAATALWYDIVTQRQRWKGYWEAVGFALVAASCLYAKQTAAFILLALTLHALWQHRPLLRQHRTWVAVGATLLFTVPLALFTLKYGSENLAQSVGSGGDVYIERHKGPGRFTVAGITYYIASLWRLLHPVVFLLAVGGVALAFRRTRGAALWTAWAVAWYLLFTIFDNKQDRFVAFVIPACFALATITVERLAVAWPKAPIRAAAMGLAVLLVLSHAWNFQQRPTRVFEGVRPVVDQLDPDGIDGSIAYFGGYRQLLAPMLRLADPERRTHLLQGDDVLADAGSLPDAAEVYRFTWVVSERGPSGAPRYPDVHAELESDPRFQPAGAFSVSNGVTDLVLEIYRWTGERADEMKQPPLLQSRPTR